MTSPADLFAEVLDRPDATADDTFAGLGGDSLSYVELSVRLEQALGYVPANWHVTPIRDLRPAPRPRFWRRTVETSVLLRAVAIVCIVAKHAHLFSVRGGAAVLLAVAGFNFARFQLGTTDRRARLRGHLVAVARIAIPSMIWIGAVFLLVGKYTLANVFLLNAVLGEPTWTRDWHFWFVENLVYLLLGAGALMAIPAVDRFERARPFAFPAVLVGLGLLTRYEIVDVGIPHTSPALWLFAIGWAAARAATARQRLLVTAVVVATVPGFYGQVGRENVVIAGIALLIWTTSLPCPAPLCRVAGVLASSSLYIYLVHWEIYPLLRDRPLLGVVASLAAGVLTWLAVSAVTQRRYRTRTPRAKTARTACTAEGSASGPPSIARMSAS